MSAKPSEGTEGSSSKMKLLLITQGVCWQSCYPVCKESFAGLAGSCISSWQLNSQKDTQN